MAKTLWRPDPGESGGVATVTGVFVLNISYLRSALLSASMLTALAPLAPALAADAAAAADAADGGADSIVVTATRRSVSLADVPINIAALGSEQLKSQRIDDVRGIAAFTPGVTIPETGPRAAGTIVLRGLSADDTSDFGNNGDSAVAIYLGEVPIYNDFKTLDLQRVEVLLGPQGTLYGAGTLAGAIRYIPNRPDPNRFSLDLHSRVSARAQSSQIGVVADGTVNIPIVKDHIALRSTFGYYFEPGFIDNPFLLKQPGVSLPQPGGAFNETVTPSQYQANFRRQNDVNFERTWTTRNTLLLQANDNLKAYLTFAYQQTKTNGRQSIVPTTRDGTAGVLGAGKYEAPFRYLEPSDRRAYLYSLELQANLWDIADLVSSTAYTLQRNNRVSDNTDLLLDLAYGYESFPAFSSFANNANRDTQFTQELRLVSTHGGPFSWTVGGFYRDITNQGHREEYTPGYANFIDSPRIDDLEYISFFDNTNKEKAAFAEATWHITSKLQATGGIRYYSYSATARGGTDLPLFGGGLTRTPFPLIQFDPSRIGQGKSGADGVVYKLNASYKFRDGLLLYTTYSTGYRIGGPNTVAPCILPLPPNQQNVCALPNELFFGPDKTFNKEIGVRASFFDNRVTINLAGYHIVWKSLQIGSQTLNGAVGITTNAAAAITKGIEFSGSARVTDRLTIAATYGYNDAHLTVNAPNLVVSAQVVPGDTSPGDGKVDAFKGDRLPGSTKHQASLIATYVQPLGDDSDLTLNWAATYKGNVLTRVGLRGFGEAIPDYWVNRASATYRTGRFEFGIFANNIFNVYAVSSVGNDFSKIGVQDQAFGISRRYYSKSIIAPRTVGFEARAHF